MVVVCWKEPAALAGWENPVASQEESQTSRKEWSGDCVQSQSKQLQRDQQTRVSSSATQQ
jgi:hypothetical protein